MPKIAQQVQSSYLRIEVNSRTGRKNEVGCTVGTVQPPSYNFTLVFMFVRPALQKRSAVPVSQTHCSAEHLLG
jgi:hypothetical protein